jgi:hypothetical protein
MTGRKGRVVSHDDGSVSYESRSRQDVSLEFLNIEEKKRFMNGDKVRPLMRNVLRTMRNDMKTAQVVIVTGAM